MSKKSWTKGFHLDPKADEVSSAAPSEAGTELEIRRRIKYGRPAQVLWGLFTEFAGNSSIHGVRYLGEKRRPLAERIWWIIVFFISLYTCGSLIVDIYVKWDESPVIVSFDEKSTPVWQIPFPAVTICPETKVQRQFLDVTKGYHMGQRGPPYTNVSEDELNLLGTISQVCDPHLFLTAKLGNTTTDASCVDDLRMMAPAFNSTMLTCKWRNKIFGDCNEAFTEILTEEGICYTFNILDETELFRTDQIHKNFHYVNHSRKSQYWSLENGYSREAGEDPFPTRVLGAGARAGLFVLLRMFEKDLDYMCRGPVQGFKILLHTPGEVPQVSKQYFRVPLSQEVVVSVRPNMITTSHGLKHYEPNRRQCFFNNERYLRFFQVYTQQNCELECLANFTETKCGCVKFSMPHGNDTKICGAASVECYNDAEDSLLSKEFNEGLETSDENFRGRTSCNCLPACTSITYEAELSQADFDYVKLFEAYDITEAEINETEGWMLSRLSIFFKETQFITSKRSELYGQTDFLANCGGLLGLFMGVSILSIVEIIYFCTIRLMCNIGMRRRKKQKVAKQTSLNISAGIEPPGIVFEKDTSWLDEASKENKT